MPNRIIREGFIESEKVNALTPPAETFFVRLMLKADDFGRFHAHPGLVRANLYPLKLETIREADISRWITEVEKAGLIALYGGPDGKVYIQIPNFGQRMRAEKSRFPDPTGRENPRIDGQMTVNGQQSAALDGDGDVDGGVAEVYTHTGGGFVEIPSAQEVKDYAARIGLVEWRALDWWREMESVGWKIKGQRVRKWRPLLDRVRTWWEEDGRPMQPPTRRNQKAAEKPTSHRDREIQEQITVKTIKIP